MQRYGASAGKFAGFLHYPQWAHAPVSLICLANIQIYKSCDNRVINEQAGPIKHLGAVYGRQ